MNCTQIYSFDARVKLMFCVKYQTLGQRRNSGEGVLERVKPLWTVWSSPICLKNIQDSLFQGGLKTN